MMITLLSIREINPTYLPRRWTNIPARKRTINLKNTTDAKVFLPWVNVGFAALEMVMQIVPKQVDQVNRVVPRCSTAQKSIKGVCQRLQVFSWTFSPRALSKPCWQSRIFTKIRGDIRKSRLITGVNGTGDRTNFRDRKFFHIFLRCC